MVDVGSLVAGMLTLGGEAMARGLLQETAKDAYKALKGKVSLLVPSKVAALETVTEKEDLIKVINLQSEDEQKSLCALAEALKAELNRPRVVLENCYGLGNGGAGLSIKGGVDAQVRGFKAIGNKGDGIEVKN
jgi:hypothetical protein